MKYFTEPPQPKRKQVEIPSFMRKYGYNDTLPVIDLAYIIELLKWAELEYNDTKNFFEFSNNIKTLNLMKKLSPRDAQVRILAETQEFKKFIIGMEEDIWNSLPRVIQIFLADVYNYYKVL